MKLTLKNRISNLCSIILIAITIGYVFRYYIIYNTSSIQTEYYEILILVCSLLSFCLLLLILFLNFTKFAKILLVVSLMLILFEKMFFLSSKVLKFMPLSEVRNHTKYSNKVFISKDLIYSNWNIQEVSFTNTTLVQVDSIEEVYLHYSNYCYFIDLSDNLYLVFWRHSNPIQ